MYRISFGHRCILKRVLMYLLLLESLSVYGLVRPYNEESDRSASGITASDSIHRSSTSVPAQIYIVEGTVIHQPENLNNAQMVMIRQQEELKNTVAAKAKSLHKKKELPEKKEKRVPVPTLAQHPQQNYTPAHSPADIFIKTVLGKNTVPVRVHEPDFPELPPIKSEQTLIFTSAFSSLSLEQIFFDKQFLSCIKIRSPGLLFLGI